MKRARSTIPCQGGGEDVGTMAEDATETDIKEGKDKFSRTVERLLKPSASKRRHRRRKEKRTGVEKLRNQKIASKNFA